MAIEGSAADSAIDLGQGWKVNPFLKVVPGTTAVLGGIKGQGAIKHFRITSAFDIPRGLILRIYFDGHENPAAEAPLNDFFCNTDPRDFRQITSLAICVNPNNGNNCYFEMPYFKFFRMELENCSPETSWVYYQIDCEELELN